MHSSPPKKYVNLRENSRNFPTFPTSEGGNGRDLHLRWESESMPRQSWTGGVIRWLIVSHVTSETPFIRMQNKKKPILKKMAIFVFSDVFCLGCLNSMKEQFLLWNNVKGGETMILFDVLSRMVATRRSEKATCECREAPDARRRVTSRDVDGRDVGRTVTRLRRLDLETNGAQAAKDGNKWCTMMQLWWQFINHLFQFVPTSATEISVGECCQAPARELRW